MHLELRALSKRYAATEVLADLDLDLPPGGIVAVIGLNGAGKTTLLRCLAGVVAPSSGEILMDGVRFMRDDLVLRRRQVILPDFPAFLPGHTVIQHLALVLNTWERDAVDESRVVALLREFDLLALAESQVSTLSRGQAYKAALVGLLLVAPELWLLDEPFASGMDPQGIGGLKAHARAATAAGATIIYTTQILEIAERFCDRLIVLDRGRLRWSFTRDELAALPPSGPESLEERLRAFREVSA